MEPSTAAVLPGYGYWRPVEPSTAAVLPCYMATGDQWSPALLQYCHVIWPLETSGAQHCCSIAMLYGHWRPVEPSTAAVLPCYMATGDQWSPALLQYCHVIWPLETSGAQHCCSIAMLYGHWRPVEPSTAAVLPCYMATGDQWSPALLQYCQVIWPLKFSGAVGVTVSKYNIL